MGEIVTFYSYKGGVGRSMALANTATLLARWGYNTLIVDWDLEAPGLEWFFRNYFDEPSVVEQTGLVDLLYAAYESTQNSPVPSGGNGRNESALESNVAAMTEEGALEEMLWKRCLVTIKIKESKAKLHLLPAGQRDANYFDRVRRFDVQEFYKAKGGGYFIEELRRQWKETYDFVLIDSRTGITDLGGICTIQLPDILVLLFTATEQGLVGAVNVAQKATAARQSLPFDRFKLLVVPVPSRFDTNVEHDLSQSWLDRFADEVSVLYSDWLPRDVRRRDMLELMKVPYKPYYSYGEKLAVVEENLIDRAGVGFAYETLTALIAHRLENTKLLREDRDGFVKQAAEYASESKQKPKTEVDVSLLNEILARHQKWLDSGERDGKRADFNKERLRAVDLTNARLEKGSFVRADLSAAILSLADISNADFSNANLQGAILRDVKGENSTFKAANLIDANIENADLTHADLQGANLQGAELVNANLTRANLEDANLTRSNLKHTKLREAVLENATLVDVSGLTISQLGGANLAGAKLPGQAVELEDLSKRLTFLKPALMSLYVLVALCAYVSYIIVGEARDVLFLNNGRTPRLLFHISLDNFFLVAPMVLFVAYISFHLYLQNVWERITEMPAIFPDKRTLDEVLDTWFVKPMVRKHFRLLREKSLSTFRMAFFIFIAWWLVPCVLLLFGLRYLPLRDWFGTGLHIFLVSFAVGAGVQFYRLAVRTLSEGGNLPEKP